MQAMLTMHKKVFSDQLGHCKPELGTHVIKLKPKSVPTRKASYRIPERLRAEEDKQVNVLLADGLIERSFSPYASPIVCVYKSDNSVRVCCDYRALNANDLIMKTGNCNWISCFDCSQGFHQIIMDPDSIEKTAFVTHNGLFQWKVMSLGLKNASSTYQRIMDRILEPHKKYASAFIDDIAVFSNTFEEHVMLVDWVLTSLEQSGITLKLIKSKFAQHYVVHLEHEIGSGQHQTSSAKVEVINL